MTQLKYPLAQTEESQDLYESRKFQLEFLLQKSHQDTQTAVMILEEAEYFAREGDFHIALDLLDMAMEELTDRMDKPTADSTLFADLLKPLDLKGIKDKPLFTGWDIAAELGSDYSRNEYELSYLESDSLILEELNNPFFALRFARSVTKGNRWFNIYNYNRLDRDIFQTSFALSLESMDYQRNWRMEGRTNWFWFLDQSRGTFWENEIRLNWNRLLNNSNRFYIQTDLRSKIYLPDNETYRNLFDGDLRVALRHNYQILHWLDFSIRPSRYVEYSGEGLSYSQLNSQIEYHNRTDYNQFLVARFNYYYRDFRNQSLSDNYSNIYHSFRPYLEFEWPFLFPLGFSSRLDMDIRRFNPPDITYSDYDYRIINFMLKYYFSVYNSVGAGYVREQENHTAPGTMEESSVNLEDFHSNGFSVSLDILHLKGLMVSLGYTFVLRTYPNAVGQDFLSIYTDRRIHTIQGFGYLPLTKNWQIQFFISYDNDQDRNLENNDNLSTLLNFSLLYQF